jgi:protein-tyrosine phosphatase
MQAVTNVPGVDYVLDKVYIGGANDVFPYASRLLQSGVSYILKLYKDEPHWPRPFVVFDHSIRDSCPVSFDQLQQGVAFIHEHQAAGQPVLVACRYGVSRSSTFVLAYLVQVRGYDLHDAWMLLKRQHPPAYPAWQLWESLIQHYDVPYTMDDIQQWLLCG